MAPRHLACGFLPNCPSLLLFLATVGLTACSGAAASTGSNNQVEDFCAVTVASNADYGLMNLTFDLTANTITGTGHGVVSAPTVAGPGTTDSFSLTGTIAGNTFTMTSSNQGVTVNGTLTNATIGGTFTLPLSGAPSGNVIGTLCP